MGPTPCCYTIFPLDVCSQVTQLKYRLSEGEGECYYLLGGSGVCFQPGPRGGGGCARLAEGVFYTRTAGAGRSRNSRAAPWAASTSEPATKCAPATCTAKQLLHPPRPPPGVEDNGHPMGLDSEHLQQSLGVLRSMAAEVGAGATLLRTPSVEGGRQCAVVLVKRRCEEEGVDYVDLRVAGKGWVRGWEGWGVGDGGACLGG